MNPIPIDQLADSWGQLYNRYAGDTSQRLNFWQELEKQYSGWGRYYHNLEHIADLLGQVEEMEEVLDDPDILRFSIWYHDIIYKSWRKDNELQSAILAKKRLRAMDFPISRIQQCYDQILLTQSHQTENVSSDAQYLIDFDLSILGRPWEKYAAYKAKVRKEFQLFPNFMYRKGRKKALQHFLDRDAIFATDQYRDAFEEQARKNLRQELAELS